MGTTTTRLLETAALTLATCLPLHYFADVDWPRALAIGLVAAVVVRAVIPRRLRRRSRVRDV